MVANVLLLLLLAAVVAVCRGAEAMKLGELDAKYRCVSGKMDGIKGEEGGGGGRHYVTVDREHTIVQLKETPKDIFRAMVRDTNHLDYDIVMDYERTQGVECKESIKGLVEAEGCWLVKVDGWIWHEGQCVGGKCTGGRLHVTCKLSEVQQIQDDFGPTGYSFTKINIWSTEECLSVSAKFTNTDRNFCYLVPQSQIETRAVMDFMGRTTKTIQQNTTAATKTTTKMAPTTQKVTAQTTTDKHGPKPTMMGPTEEEHGDEQEVSPSLSFCMDNAGPFVLLYYFAFMFALTLVALMIIAVLLSPSPIDRTKSD